MINNRYLRKKSYPVLTAVMSVKKEYSNKKQAGLTGFEYYLMQHHLNLIFIFYCLLDQHSFCLLGSNIKTKRMKIKEGLRERNFPISHFSPNFFSNKKYVAL